MPSLIAPKCPRCDAPMALRSGRYGKFWGCTEYPTCKGTRKFVQERQEIERRPFEMAFEPSIYQKAIFDFVKHGHGHAVVEAVAGSGKTTTILAALQFTPSDSKVAFVAFNKRIADELKARAPAHVSVSTLHSLGFRNIRKVYRRVKVDDRKVYTLIHDLADDSPRHGGTIRQDARAIERLVSLVKSTLSPTDDRSLEILGDNFDVDVNGSASIVYDAVRTILARSLDDISCLDFDDMIYWPVVKPEIACETFDYLFVDETQDLNASQLELVKLSIRSSGRVIAVGDRWQSIYGFRGADVNAIPNMIDALQAETLPLSISYRCPVDVVKLAQTLVPHIEHAPNAKQGLVADVSIYELDQALQDGDFVLCRRNAPLVAIAYRMLARGVKVVILGRDIGASIIALIDKVIYKTHCGQDIVDFERALDGYIANEVERLMDRGRDMRAASLLDKAEVIHILASGNRTVDQVKTMIDRIFSDETSQGITFGTVHKMKGLESERVFLLCPNELGSAERCRTEDQIQQELNIAYVAYTRAKSELYFVQGQ